MFLCQLQTNCEGGLSFVVSSILFKIYIETVRLLQAMHVGGVCLICSYIKCLPIIHEEDIVEDKTGRLVVIVSKYDNLFSINK